MKSILIIAFNILLIFSLNRIFIKKKFLVDKKLLAHKSFVSKNLVPISGGFLIIANLLLFNNNYLAITFFLAMFILGIFSDLFIIRSPLKKFIIQFLIVILFLFFSKISILSTKIEFIDFLIQNKLFSLLFTSFCLLILINGSNFLDGINTLVCGYYILVVAVIMFIGHNNQINYNFFEYYYLLLSLLIIFCLNFFSKTYLGDSGTFLVSFLIGSYLINLCNVNLSLTKYVSPIFILLLLWYPAFENLFSIIRKTLNDKNPTKPDNLHLHHLLFIFLKKRIKNEKVTNSLTGLLINSYNLLIFIIGAQFYNKTNVLLLLVIINIFIYLASYFFLMQKKLIFK